MNIPKKFKVIRSEWHRGQGSGNSFLLTASGKRCCVGFLAKEMGLSDDECRLIPTLHQVLRQHTRQFQQEEEEMHIQAFYLADSIIRLSNIYDTNDERTITDSLREKDLTTSFSSIGIEVEFED